MSAKPTGNALLAAIARAAEPEDVAVNPKPSASPRKRKAPDKIEEQQQEENEAPAATSGSRIGTRLIAGHFDPAIARQLRMLAAEEDTTIQALLAEALDLLFVKKGKGRILKGN